MTAKSVLGIGIPADTPLTPPAIVPKLQAALDLMEEDMKSSPYDWEMFYFHPEVEYELLHKKLKERQWDIVMVGVGLRKTDQLTPFFERIINTVHEELPKAKFAFNVEISKPQEACRRVLAP